MENRRIIQNFKTNPGRCRKAKISNWLQRGKILSRKCEKTLAICERPCYIIAAPQMD
jgi:hypothetical protein